MKQPILRVLEEAAGRALSVKEVGKRVDRETYRQNPNWARPFLKALVADGLVVQEPSGCFVVPRG